MERDGRSGGKRAGIRMNHLNMLLILAGLVLAALMAVSMYRTTDSVREVVDFTDSYLSNQQTGGMLRDLSEGLGEKAAEFVRSGDPGAAREYEGRLNAINAQLEQYDPQARHSGEANEVLRMAMDTFRARNAAELRAMRLAADDLPAPAFGALPDFLKNAELTEEDRALTPAEKKENAEALLTSEEYLSGMEQIRESADRSQRLVSEAGRKQADETFSRVREIVRGQTILILLFTALAVLALILNRVMVLAPMQRSVGNLDRREPIAEKGCYEMRHLARVYNDVLKDNEEKTEELSYTASHDALTGVYNRDAFDKHYRQIEHREHYGIIMLDVDHFKQFNDEYGHDIGDRVLQTAVEAIKRHFRSEDHISRVGGDEFCIIMPGTDFDQAEKIREKIVSINRELKEDRSDLPSISISAGIAFWDRPNPEGSLLKDADSALMDLKKTRNQCCAVYGA